MKQHHRAHCTEIGNVGYRNLETKYQIAKRLFLKWKCLRLFTYLWQSTLNCKQKYPRTLWTPFASTSGMPNLKKCICLALTYWQHLLQVMSGTAADLLRDSSC